MPVLRIDYNSSEVDDVTIKDFCDTYLAKAIDVYGMGKEFFSIFVRPFGTFDFSTALIEVECVAGAHEYSKDNENEKEVRERYAKELADAIAIWKRGKMDGAIISTITSTPWKVTWID
jgi:hypothetical protein